MEIKKNIPSHSKLENALNRWQLQEQKYVQRFGREVLGDRDFMKVKAAAFQLVFDQHKNAALSFEEKMDLRILRGQIRQMKQRIYPNPYIRVASGGGKLLLRPVQAAAKLGVNILSMLLTGKAYFTAAKKPSHHVLTRQVQQPAPKKVDTSPLPVTRMDTPPPAIRKHFQRAQAERSDTPEKTIRR